ncbi:DUF1801 domain-containing protein [Nocardia takedensis]
MSIPEAEFERFLAGTGPRAKELRALDAVIRSSAPGFEPVLFDGSGPTMLAYGLLPYRSKSAKETTRWPVVSLAPRKNYVSLYLAAIVDGQYVAETHADRLGKVDCGKSCIRFKKLSDLNLDTLREILADLDRRRTAGERLYGEPER